MHLTPDRAGWWVVTRNIRLAVGCLILIVVLDLSFGLDLIRAALWHRDFSWSSAFLLSVSLLWTARLAGTVLWLRRDAVTKKN